MESCLINGDDPRRKIARMSTGLSRLAGLATLFIGLVLTDSSAEGEMISIADPNLEQAIRVALDKPVGELTEEDLQQLIVLEAPHCEITTLDGFSVATNLIVLDLSFNSLSAVTLTPGFPSLEMAKFCGNQATNLTVTGPLPSLMHLELSENLIADLAFLSQMPELTYLDLEYNELVSFDPGTNLLKLDLLDLAFNQVHNLSFLAKLPTLSALFLDDNGLDSVELPASLPNLKQLGLAVNRISDLSFLTMLPNLERLDLPSNFASQYEFLDGLSHLQFLNLGENRLTNVIFSPEMTNLTTLFLDDNRFTEIPNLASLRSLRTLDLALNQLTQILIPYTLTNLTTLDISDNPLETLILAETLATNSLAATVSDLTNRGISVLIYSATPYLTNVTRTPNGRFDFVLRGPPGTYDVLRSEDLHSWSVAGVLTNVTGVTDYSTEAPSQVGRAYYRTQFR